ncbi:MAG: hypothetical protein JOZ08_02820 [Verrucomicrobia bacterium]|nr:hypothetical protein [Verrucomicrobiota bacterium]
MRNLTLARKKQTLNEGNTSLRARWPSSRGCRIYLRANSLNFSQNRSDQYLAGGRREKYSLRSRTVAALFVGCWLLVGIGRSDDMIPKGFDVGRYQQIWERNPFTLVTPSLGQGPASPFSKLILVNWLHDKGKDILFVQDTETNEVKKVTKDDGANSDRLRLIEVVPNKNPSLIFAKLTNGREEGIVKFKFDQGQSNQVVNPNLAMQRPIPGQLPVGQNGQQFGGNAGGPLRRGPQVPQVPQVPGANRQNFQQNPGNAPDAQDVRRRRMLPTPPQNPAQQNNAPQTNAPQNNVQQNNNPAAESDDDDE